MDEAGNVDESPAVHSWIVDTVPPSVVIVYGPPDPSRLTTAGFDFDSDATDVVRFECELTAGSTAGGWETCSSSQPYTGLVHGVRYRLRVRAVDRAGNATGMSGLASHSWTVDTEAPETRFTGTLPEVTSQNVSFTFTSDDTDVERFECSLDAAPFAQCTSPYTPASMPAEGIHTLQVRAVDEAGNVDESPSMHSWIVDTVPPDTRISPDAPVPPRTRNNSRSAVFGFTSPANDVAHFECKLDEDGASPGDWGECPAIHVLHDLTDGASYLLQVRAVDRAGNLDLTPASHPWIVDVTPPETVITSGPQELTSDLVAIFQFESPNHFDIDFYECSLDGAQFTECESGVKFQMDDGLHKMLIRAVDLAGNLDDTPATHVWRVNSGPVTTEIKARPAPLTNDPVAQFVFTSNKGTVSFKCRVDTVSEEKNCGFITPEDRETAPHIVTVADGIHTINVHAVDMDNGGRDEIGVPYTWVVDTRPPGPPTITSPSTEYINTTEPAIVGTAPEPGTVTVYLGDLNVGQTTVTGALTWELRNVLLEERQYVLRATLTDKAQNTGALGDSEPRIFTVDVTPPDTAITSGPLSWGRERTVTFELEHLQEVNFAAFECSLDGEPYRECSTPYVVTVTQEGPHGLQVRARDLAGNVDLSPATYSWNVDWTPPETTIAEKPALFDRSESAQFSFTSSESFVRFECSLDGSPFGPCDNPASFPGLSEESHTLRVRAIDSVGNVDDSPDSYTWTVDHTPPDMPTLSVPGPGSAVETRTPQFRGSSQGGASQVVVLVDGVERGRAPVDSAGQWRFTVSGALPDGEHSVSIYAVDQAGNESARTALVVFQIIPSTEIDSRGGGLSCSLGGSGRMPLASLGLTAAALLVARRRRKP